MDRYRNKDCVTEMACGANFAYILNNNNYFLNTEYKVLQSQTSGSFVPCMKLMYNGKIQLYYLTKGLTSLEILLATMHVDTFWTIVTNLCSAILDVKRNGFLSCQNIHLSFERIYVDTSTNKVSLVYLPLSRHIYDGDFSFENELRSSLVKAISTHSNIFTPKTMRFSAELSNNMLSIEELYTYVKHYENMDDIRVQSAEEPVRIEKRNLRLLRIVAMDAPSHMVIEVTKDEFTLGKKADLCDGVLSFNPMLSRMHCKIHRVGDGYTVTDLRSTNGTYVNRVKLQPNQQYTLHDGDILRLANSDFRISIEERKDGTDDETKNYHS